MPQSLTQKANKHHYYLVTSCIFVKNTAYENQ